MSVVPYPQTDKHINEHTHNYTPIETQHIINEPTVPYLQARCTNKTNMIKSPYSQPSQELVSIQFSSHKFRSIARFIQSQHMCNIFKHCKVYSCHSGDPLTWGPKSLIFVLAIFPQWRPSLKLDVWHFYLSRELEDQRLGFIIINKKWDFKLSKDQ